MLGQELNTRIQQYHYEELLEEANNYRLASHSKTERASFLSGIKHMGRMFKQNTQIEQVDGFQGELSKLSTQTTYTV